MMGGRSPFGDIEKSGMASCNLTETPGTGGGFWEHNKRVV